VKEIVLIKMFDLVKFNLLIMSSRLDTDLMLGPQPNSAERESESEGKAAKKS
jgi:hypothetical protein